MKWEFSRFNWPYWCEKVFRSYVDCWKFCQLSFCLLLCSLLVKRSVCSSLVGLNLFSLSFLGCCIRLIVAFFIYPICSYHWIRRKGKPAPRERAPIVVSNHVSYIEPIFYFYELCPTIVASESHDSIPFVGTIIRAMQVT